MDLTTEATEATDTTEHVVTTEIEKIASTVFGANASDRRCTSSTWATPPPGEP